MSPSGSSTTERGTGWDGDAVPPGAALEIAGIAKTFGVRRVLHPFTLRIEPGEIHALLGQNGSGKSTLIKILSGFHLPDAGAECRVGGDPLEFGSPSASGRLGLRFVHQDLGLILEASVLDNLAFTRGYATRWGSIRTRSERERAVSSLQSVGLDIDPRAPVAHLTPAQRTGVALARAVGSDTPATVLVLDEPTATLPGEEVEHLHRMLRATAARGVAILYVTHHLDEVFRLANRVSVLRDGHLVESCGVDEIDHATLVQRLIGTELTAVHRARSPRAAGDDHIAFELRGLRTEVIRGASLVGRSGEIVGVYGATGSGRESLLGAAFGALPRLAGTVSVDGMPIDTSSPQASIAHGIGYLPPDRKVLGSFLHMTAAENLTMLDIATFWRFGLLHDRAELKDAAQWFERLQVSPRDGTSQPLSSFSGGNQQKIVVGKWLRVAPRVLLLDEPTQGVDVGAKAGLHQVIMGAAANGTVVVVSSTDVEELATLCDRVLIMSDGRFSAELVGDAVTEESINRAFLGKRSDNAKETADP